MAIIHGKLGPEKDIMLECPPTVTKFEDIEKRTIELQTQIREQELNHGKELEAFNDAEEKRIKTAKNGLVESEERLKEIEEKYRIPERELQAKVQVLKNSVIEQIKKKDLAQFTKLLPRLFYTKFLEKPAYSTGDRILLYMQRERVQIQRNLAKPYANGHPPSLDAATNKSKRELSLLVELKKSKVYCGAIGERQVLKELSKLNDNYHVFCDVKIILDKCASYKKQYNLRTAHMDLVVVGKTGLFIIEVKNWSAEYAKNGNSFSPHEQVDRHARALWVTFKKEFPNCTNPKQWSQPVIVSIQGSIKYNPLYKRVMVKYPNNVCTYITKRKEILTDSDISQIVRAIKKHNMVCS